MAPFRFDDAGPWPLGEFPHLAAVAGVVHAVTTRDGPEFSTDARSAQTAIASAEVAAHLGLAGAAHVKQVHGGTVLRVRTPGLAGEADALVTDTPGLAVVGRSADCPIILAAGRRDDGTAAVGFAHASWRATVRGITTAMIAMLRDELGVLPETIRAGIAPSAGPCCYEVGDEVRAEALGRLGPDADRFFLRGGERRHFDLWSANTTQLRDAGVPAEQIAVAGVCTICRGERFWSWRAQGERAGRFAGVIGVSSR